MIKYFPLRPAFFIKGQGLKVPGRDAGQRKSVNSLETKASVIGWFSEYNTTCGTLLPESGKSLLHQP